MAKKSRQMPQAGYYVYAAKYIGNYPNWKLEKVPGGFLPGSDADDINIIYTTGIPGKGGHKYYRIMGGDTSDAGWATLLWSCVPGIEEIERQWVYYPELPPGVPPIQ